MDVKPGQRFGTLVVVESVGKRVKKSGRPARAWRCRCSCGTVETISQGELTGGFRRRCVSCWRKIIKELGISEEGLIPGGAIPRRDNYLTVDRRTKSGFIKYWSQARYHFYETFGRVYSDTVALEEWQKLFPTTKIKGER